MESSSSANSNHIIIDPALAPFLCTPAQFLARHPDLHGVLAGAVVYRRSPDHARGLETLAIRRAATDSWPLLWEHPGGSVEVDKDPSLVHAAVRELQEEGGLVARRVICPVGLRKMFSSAGVEILVEEEDARMDSDDSLLIFRAKGRNWGKLTVLVDVREADATVNPQEHDRYYWMTQDEVANGRLQLLQNESIRFVSEGVKRTLLEGFRLLNDPTLADGAPHTS
ncbi:hypothetical protein K461DRAFT_280290 [Myriangium duriaei CBS 260.36]|uniref:Nudix hydrolase domain-containing protein n=1 Tax=Myriangium duriaei CBS 260.36 TaxID=1168546 RepID=A0A9P4J1C2_9PEZI|nr:hypothetical protein K461DRAFT_280290 [Myriangium duriaei CBS 260.36]